MIITVIGHICKDIVNFPEGEIQSVESFGGIFYTLLTLTKLLDEEDIIQPIFGIGQTEYDAFIERIKPYKNIDPGGIYKFKGQTNSVHLFYQNDGQSRTECSKNISAPIPFNRIKPYLDGDGILINMVSGSDITLETLDLIRMEIRERRIPIHFDFHSLTLGIDQEFKRFRRPLTDWRRWCFMLHSVQMSEEEAAGLSAERFDETTLINHLMPLMVDTVLITRGDRGVSVILQDIHKKLTHRDIAGIKIDGAKDPTGCGDVFGAAYLFFYLKSRDALAAAEFANQVAALKTTINSAEDFETLTEKINFLNKEKKVE